MLYLELGDVTGDAHEGAIELARLSNGVTRGALMSRAAQHAAEGPPSFAPIEVWKRIDSATPDLLRLCAQGQTIPEATITRYTAADGKQPIFRITLKDVKIGRVDLDVSSNGDGTVEKVDLTYAEIDYVYTRYDRQGNGTEFKSGYDVIEERVK